MWLDYLICSVLIQGVSKKSIYRTPRNLYGFDRHHTLGTPCKRKSHKVLLLDLSFDIVPIGATEIGKTHLYTIQKFCSYLSFDVSPQKMSQAQVAGYGWCVYQSSHFCPNKHLLKMLCVARLHPAGNPILVRDAWEQGKLFWIASICMKQRLLFHILPKMAYQLFFSDTAPLHEPWTDHRNVITFRRPLDSPNSIIFGAYIAIGTKHDLISKYDFERRFE